MRFFSVMAALCVALAAAGAAAQSVAEWPETQAMLSAPDDEATVYAFVTRARAAGKGAEAANALERLLRFDPQNQRALEDIADIYDELGFSARADAFRARAGTAEASAFEITGFVSVGAGYDSNPAAAPRDQLIGLNIGGDVRQIDLGARKDDTFLGEARGKVIIRAAEAETLPPVFLELDGRATFFDDANNQDDYALGLKAGREYDLEGARLRPFLEGGVEFFDHEPYAVSAGLGADYRFALGETLVTVEGAAGWREFFETDSAPSRDDMDGAFGRLGVTAFGALDEGVFGYASLVGFGRAARVDYESFAGLTGIGALVIEPDVEGPKLTLTFGGGASAYHYFGADPTFSPNRDRRDLQLFGFAGIGIEVMEDTSVDFSVSYRSRFSRYDVYESDGVRATLKLVRRF